MKTETRQFTWWKSRYRPFWSILAFILAVGTLLPFFSASATTCPTSGNDVTISVSCIFDAGTYTFTGTLTINAGVTVTAASNVGNGQVIIISDSINVQGTVNGNGTGFAGATGTGPGQSGGCGAGGAHGGNGGNGSSGCSGAPVGGTAYGSVTQPSTLGSGGGHGFCCSGGGAGGAAIKLSVGAGTGTITIGGTVTANGNVGGSGNGAGGAGGSIWIDAPNGTVTGAGTIVASGGSGPNPSGGGGGGRIAIYYSGTTPSMTMQTFGGSATSPGVIGGAGTIFMKSASQANGDIIIDNSEQNGADTPQVVSASQTFDTFTIRKGAFYRIPSSFTLTLAATGALLGGGTTRGTITNNSGGTFNLPTQVFTVNNVNLTNNGALGVVKSLATSNSIFTHGGTFPAGLDDLSIGSGSTYTLSGLGTFNIANITVQSGGTLTHNANTTTKTHAMDIHATGNITVDSGGTISVVGKGFQGAAGTGAGQSGGCGAGGAHGGNGGNGRPSCSGAPQGGSAYGVAGSGAESVTQPSTLGSGGGHGFCCSGGGAGGGAIKLVVDGTLTVNGSVNANGANGGSAGGGAGGGGSIWIDTPTISGTGTVTANGGNGGEDSAGAGGGGRVAVYYTGSLPITPTAYGGTVVNNATIGGSGTVFTKANTQTNGSLVINNNNQNGANTPQVASTSQTYDAVTVNNGTKYVVVSTSTLTVVSSGTLTGGGSVQPSVTTNSGGTFNPPSATFTLTALDITNNGTTGVVTGLTVGPTATFTHHTGTGSFSAGLNALTVGNSGSGTFSTAGTTTFSVPTATVNSGGNLTHNANTNTKANVLDLTATTVTVNSGGTISVQGKGFSGGNGPGVGTTGGCGSGGGHGGKGGNAQSSCSGSPQGGTTYGTAGSGTQAVSQPSDLGSGGTNNCCGTAGAAGGGSLKMNVSGTLTVAGNLSANGNTATDNGGGAGGSVWLVVGTLAGAGNITADGGTASSIGGGGGGGRVSITVTSTTHAGAVTAYGGASTATNTSNVRGGAGTIYRKSPADTNGNLIVNNNNLSNVNDTLQLTGTSQTFDSITVNNGAEYVVPSTSVLTVAPSGTFTTGGTQRPAMTTNSGGTFDLGVATKTVSGIDVTNNGTMASVTNLTIDSSNFIQNGNFSATLTDVTCNASSKFTLQSMTGVALGNATMNSGGTFSSALTSVIPITAVSVNSGGTLTHEPNTTTKTSQLSVSATTVTVVSGGLITADAKGFTTQNGTGKGTDSCGAVAGAGYGGNGGNATGAGGVTYGTGAAVTQPTDLGSGGGKNTCAGTNGGSGGGAIKLVVSGTLTNGGTISSIGGANSGNVSGGGSGGSIWLDAASYSGNGTVSAAGGVAPSAGAGGGGRIALYYIGSLPSFILAASGGAGASATQIGGAGTIYTKSSSATNGDLVVDNANQNGASTTQAGTASQTYDNVTIRQGAKYVIPATMTLVAAAGFTAGGTLRPSLTINSGAPAGRFDPPSATFTFTGIDVTNNGTIGVVTSFTATSGIYVNNGSFSPGLTTLTVASGATFRQTSTINPFSGSDLIIQNGGTFEQNHTSVIAVTNVVVETGGTLTHSDNSTAKNAIVNISATTMNVQAGAFITADAKGFDGSEGTGQGIDAGTAGGGGYCGSGGNGSTPGAGGSAYGSSSNPADLGSGGGDDTNFGGQQGGAGGGEIKLAVSGTLTVAGSITANGQNGIANEGGGGSGGTINLSVGTWAGNGAVTANGGGGSLTTSSTVGGGGGSGGRIAVSYGGKTYIGVFTSTGGNKGGFGGSSAATPGTTCAPIEQQSAPSVTSVTHSPSNPFTTDAVTLSGSATYPGLINKIEIYLDGTAPANLKHTCIYAPAQSPASCQTNVGFLSNGSHTTTVKAYGVDTSVGTGTETFSVGGSTLSGNLIFSRTKVSVSSSFTLSFALSGTSTGTLTVTFPAQFTVTAPASGSASSSCLSGFGSTSTTLTATKTGCSGTVVLGGSTVTNPATPGQYVISWTNDSGSGAVFIVADDQINVSATVDPTLTFNVGSQAAATPCDGTFATSGGTVGLGVLTTSAVSSSDAAGAPHICTRVTTNGNGGAAVTVRSLNASLKSTSAPADTIPSSTTTLTPGTAGYGICAGSAGADSGSDATTPVGAVPARSAPFNGVNCTSGAHDVGALTTNAQNIWTLSSPSQNAFVRIYVKASISPSTAAHNDYMDTLTFVATGTY